MSYFLSAEAILGSICGCDSLLSEVHAGAISAGTSMRLNNCMPACLPYLLASYNKPLHSLLPSSPNF